MARIAWLLGFGTLTALLLPPRAVRAEVVLLQTLEQVALRNRPVLVASRARTRAAEAELDQAQSGYNPRLALQAQGTMGPGVALIHVRDEDSGELFRVQGARPIGNGDAFKPSFRNELELELKGNLYDFGRTRAAVDAGRAQHASAEAEEEATREAIVQAVRAAYLAWLGQVELVAIAEQAATDTERRSERVLALIEEGARPKAELSIARADEMLAKLELERTRGELRAARLTLEQAVGSKLPEPAQPDRSLLLVDELPAPSRGDAALRALALKQQAVAADARRLEQTAAPLLAGVLSAGVRAQDQNVFPAYAVGLSFGLPLWDGGVANAGAAAARARAEAIGAELHEQRQQQQHERERAQLDHGNASAQLQTAEELLAVVQQRLSEAEQSYELGAGGLESVAQARSLLRRAQTEVVHAKLARAEARIRYR